MDFRLPEQHTAQFYRAFEDKHRGSREVIRQRLGVYLPFLRPLAQSHPGLPVLDLGCGRGEWLELLQANLITAHGVDLDEGMLAACRERGLSVSNADALAHLAALPAHSQLAVTGFHIAEHLLFADLQTLLAQARRVLVPGGLLILETPNPENLVVGSANFYIDPSHQRPLPSQLLSFLVEYQGFEGVKLLRLQEEARLASLAPVGLYDVLGNASPDYAIVARSGPAPADRALEAAFAAEHGVSLYALASRYDEQAQQRLNQQQQSLLQLQQQLEQLQQHRLVQLQQQLEQLQQQLQHLRAQQAEQVQATQTAQRQTEEALALARQDTARADQFAAALNTLHASHSWRITRPLRWLARQFRRGSGGV